MTECTECQLAIFLSDSTIEAALIQDVGYECSLKPYCFQCGYERIKKYSPKTAELTNRQKEEIKKGIENL